jgi:hypothetical protein
MERAEDLIKEINTITGYVRQYINTHGLTPNVTTLTGKNCMIQGKFRVSGNYEEN